jgi:hypothetical protein
MSYYESNAATAYISNTYGQEVRFCTIILNTLREGAINCGRGDMPFTDNDAAIFLNLFSQVKSMTGEASVNRQTEHQPLAIAKDAPSIEAAKVAETLATLPDEIRTEAEPVLVKASLPKVTK